MDYDALPDRSSRPSPASENPYSQPPDPPPDAAAIRRRRLLRWVAIPVLTALFAALAGVVVGASINKPEVDSLDDLHPRLITEVRDQDGLPFQTYSREKRILLDENELPKRVEQAILAAEDSNFYEHGGIDLKGVLRAAVKNVLAGRKKEGASTITMQLARTLFLHRERKWKRKIEETFLAVELEKKLSKQQILTLYANIVNFGHGNYGMEAASRAYFNKSADAMTVAEAATLAGIPQRPSYFSIRRNPEAVEKRRNYVLGRMLEEGFITAAEHTEAVATQVAQAARPRERQLAPYFAEEIRRELQETYGTDALYDSGLQVTTTLDPTIQRATEDALRAGLVQLDREKGWRGPVDQLDLEAAAAEEGGLSRASWAGRELEDGAWAEGIVLTSDARRAEVQIGEATHVLERRGIKWTRRREPQSLLKPGDVAWFRLVEPEQDEAPEEQDEAEDKPWLELVQVPELEAAVVVIESSTGAVRGMVGGWDFERNEFNRATQARRQVGSAFKPFVFGAALEGGFTAADTLFDGPVVFPGSTGQPDYSPRNFYRQYYGVVTLRRALEKSYNVSAVKLLDMVGIEKVIDFARRCGITSDMPPYPSLALGTAELTPLELAGAYATVVNGGIHVEPYMMERVESASGRLVWEHVPRASKAMEPQQAFVLTQMLRGVAVRGTGASGIWGLAREPIELGGKTGTTNAYTDAWFAGFSPRYTILTWVGYDKKRFLGRGMTGAHAALPIWTRVARRGLKDGWLEEGETFARPPGVSEREVEATVGVLATPDAQETLVEVFVDGTEPELRFDARWKRVVQLPWYLQEPFYLPKEGERMPAHIEDWTTVREVWENRDKGNRGSQNDA